MGRLKVLAEALSNDNADCYTAQGLAVKKRNRSQSSTTKAVPKAKRHRVGGSQLRRTSQGASQVSAEEPQADTARDAGLDRLNRIFANPSAQRTAVVTSYDNHIASRDSAPVQSSSFDNTQCTAANSSSSSGGGKNKAAVRATLIGMRSSTAANNSPLNTHTTTTTTTATTATAAAAGGARAAKGDASRSGKVLRRANKSRFAGTSPNAAGEACADSASGAGQSAPTSGDVATARSSSSSDAAAARSSSDAAADGEQASTVTPEMAAQLERRKWTVFVGNVKVGTTATVLAKALRMTKKDYESIYFRSMPLSLKFHSNQRDGVLAKGYSEVSRHHNAYVLCRSAESYADVLSKNGTLMGDDVLRVSPLTGRTFSKFEKKRTVFVGNMPLTTTETELHNTFNEIGSVEGCRTVRDATTRFGKGFGFVCFHDQKSWRRALKSDIYLQDRKLRITKAVGQNEAKTAKDEKNLKRKQDMLARRQKSANTKDKRKPKFVHVGHQKTFLKPVLASD